MAMQQIHSVMFSLFKIQVIWISNDQ